MAFSSELLSCALPLELLLRSGSNSRASLSKLNGNERYIRTSMHS